MQIALTYVAELSKKHIASRCFTLLSRQLHSPVYKTHLHEINRRLFISMPIAATQIPHPFCLCFSQQQFMTNSAYRNVKKNGTVVSSCCITAGRAFCSAYTTNTYSTRHICMYVPRPSIYLTILNMPSPAFQVGAFHINVCPRIHAS
jgi:hypothetical protein